MTRTRVEADREDLLADAVNLRERIELQVPGMDSPVTNGCNDLGHWSFYFGAEPMYRFDAEGIHMKWGLIFRNEIMLNYSRIQDIHLQSNIVERWLGLARIVVQTASGSASQEMTLEGIPDHNAMRDFLYSRMRGARHAAPSAPTDDPLAATFHEVAEELRQIRRLLEERDV